jgi:SWI/SNF-related matrix-associated actin-dependent regulator 1 of chromatin subfamily A
VHIPLGASVARSDALSDAEAAPEVILDYVEATGAFVLRVPRNDPTVNLQELMNEHGLDLSLKASTQSEAVFFTREPYAAVTFFAHGTNEAKQKLTGLVGQIQASWKATSDHHWRIPEDKELWPFQGGSLEYALARTHTLIGDEPGLGKTPIAITYANEIDANRVLVICPANIRLQWATRVQEWSTMPWQQRIIHPILNGKHGVHPTANWTIVSYDLARTAPIGKALAKQKYDLLILDEVHYLKTIGSRRTRAIFGGGEGREFDPIVDQAKRVLALTGTPLPNRPREAYTLARSLCWDSIDWASEDKFRDRYNPSRKVDGFRGDGTPFTYIDERSGRHAELQNRLRANFMVRHLKREVMPQLQMPIFDLIQVEPTRAIKQALDAESLLDIDPETLEGADAALLGHVAVVRRQMGIAMAPSVADYVDMLLLGGETKLVLFAWHIEVLNILEERLLKYGVVRIDGRTSPTGRERMVNRFVTDPTIQVCLGNLLAMGIGTDGLQLVSNHALIAEPDWTPGVNVQAFDRLDRGGQTRQVQGDIFVAPGSIAEKVLASALRKHHTTHKALDRRL